MFASGIKGGVKIVATVLNPHRFPDRGHYLAYCGLVWHQKFSGGRSYGQRRPRFDRLLKSVYKTAAVAVLHGQSALRDYYDALRAKGVADHHARHALARKIATISYGLWKNNTAYRPPEPERSQLF
jgi:transposase